MEMDPTKKTDVYFVFPNLVVKDKNKCTCHGVLVKSCDGCMISWDGALLHHCTSLEKYVLININQNMKNLPLVLLHHLMLLIMEVLYQKCVVSDNFSTKKACRIMRLMKDSKIC